MTSHTPDVDKAGQVVALQRHVIIGPIAANIAFVLELTLVPLLLPAIQQEFGLSIGELAWVFNSYGFAVAIGVLLGGWCGDAFNTKRVFGFGVALFAAGSLVVAVAGNIEPLMIGRALQGLGGGIFSPLVPLLLTRASPRRPGRVLIFWGSIAGYIAALAPLFYGSLGGELGWNVAFIFIAVIAAIALLILIGSRTGDDFTRHARAPINFAELLHARKLWATYIYVYCTYGSITYFLFRLPVWLSENEIKTASVGLTLSIMWLTYSGLSTLLRDFVDRHYIRVIMLAAPLLIAAGFSLSYFNETFLVLFVSAVFVGSGLACSNAPSTQMVLRLAPKGLSAVSTSLDITFARFGGIATVGILAETEFVFAALAICALSLIAAICALMASNELVRGM